MTQDTLGVAVIGLGPAGLAALKCLREESFEATGFERRGDVGGLWHGNDISAFTTALDDTVCNISKFVSGFSDFPLPKDCATHPSSAEAGDYFKAYARHFDLYPHIRLNTTVKRVTRSACDTYWEVSMVDPEGGSTLHFDRVVFCHGGENLPRWPAMPGRDKFKGVVMHGQAYRGPSEFQGKNVLVVGLGNTACEISLSLRSKAKKVYQSYRRGRILLSRYDDDGVPLDLLFTWPSLRLKYLLDHTAPWLMRPLSDKLMVNWMVSAAARSEPEEDGVSRAERTRRTEKRMREEWNLLPTGSMAHQHPVVQEEFIPALRSGDITPVKGFEDFVGEKEVRLADGTVVEVDTVIFCTGYEFDFSIMPELEMDGACGMPLHTAQDLKRDTKIERGSGEEPALPRLYQMMLPPRRADSIAFLSWMNPQENRWSVAELSAMALAQIWAAEDAKSPGVTTRPENYRAPAVIPSVEDMNAQVDEYHAWFRGEWCKDHSVTRGLVRGHGFFRFLHGAAGTGLYENMDHPLSTRGWALWWSDRELWTWLAKGPMNSHSWRLFETNPLDVPGCGRKMWPEARKTVQEAYEDAKSYEKEMREKLKEV